MKVSVSSVSVIAVAIAICLLVHLVGIFFIVNSGKMIKCVCIYRTSLVVQLICSASLFTWKLLYSWHFIRSINYFMLHAHTSAHTHTHRRQTLALGNRIRLFVCIALFWGAREKWWKFKNFNLVEYEMLHPTVNICISFLCQKLNHSWNKINKSDPAQFTGIVFTIHLILCKHTETVAWLRLFIVFHILNSLSWLLDCSITLNDRKKVNMSPNDLLFKLEMYTFPTKYIYLGSPVTIFSEAKWTENRVRCACRNKYMRFRTAFCIQFTARVKHSKKSSECEKIVFSRGTARFIAFPLEHWND